jgi:hypothetical protein
MGIKTQAINNRLFFCLNNAYTHTVINSNTKPIEKIVQLNATMMHHATLQAKATPSNIFPSLLFSFVLALWDNRNNTTARANRMHSTINIAIVSSLS